MTVSSMAIKCAYRSASAQCSGCRVKLALCVVTIVMGLGLVMITGLGCVAHYHDPAEFFTHEELTQLIERGNAGDGASAYSLYGEYLARGQTRKSDYWLLRAASLNDPSGQQELAYYVEQGWIDYRQWGTNRETVVVALLTAAAATLPEASWRLGERYEHGRLGQVDLPKAVYWYRDAARRGYAYAWRGLANLLADAGGTNRVEAYYWSSLHVRFFRPECVAGREMWKLRSRLWLRVPQETVEGIWAQIDRQVGMMRNGKADLLPLNLYRDGNDGEEERRAEIWRSADEKEMRSREAVRQQWTLSSSNGVPYNPESGGEPFE